MPDIALVTDSTSDLPAGIREQYDITVVPLMVTIAGETIPDGSFSQEEYFKRMNAANELPTTSQPSVGTFIDAYREALEGASQIISVHISTKLSGTISSATRAAEEFPGRVHVIDSRSLSMGLGLQVIEVAKLIASGLDVDAIVERAETLRDSVQLMVGLDGFENIVKGGRVPKLAGQVGSILKVKLTLTTQDGALELARAVRGSRAALAYGVRWMEGHMGDAKRGTFCVMHALSADKAEQLKQAILERYEPSAFYFAEAGTVISTHTGTGWGLTFFPEADRK